MKNNRLPAVLTVLNLALLVVLLTQFGRVEADGVAPVLRGRQLEIVDDQGRVRASIKIHPADSKFKMPDGRTGYPETVMFRLIDPNGRPEVKLGASVEGAGLGLIGDNDTTHALLEAQGTSTQLKLTNKDGHQQLIKP